MHVSLKIKTGKVSKKILKLPTFHHLAVNTITSVEPVPVFMGGKWGLDLHIIFH